MFRNQINIRIFFITCFILLASSAVTYLIIAYATPVSYTTMITSRFENTEENILPSFVTENDNHITSFTITNISQPDNVRIFNISSQRDMVVAALIDVIPSLIISMLVISFLGALFYSRYITRLSNALSELKNAHIALKQDMERERELEMQRTAFFSAVSHELKTPVTILKGQLHGMLDGVGIYQNRDKYLSKALQVTCRMENLVQEILTVSRMESNQMSPRLQTINLNNLITQQIDEIDDLLVYKEMTVSLSIAESISITVDPVLLQKVNSNLLSNAVFYAPEKASLSLSAIQTLQYTELQVENSGSHIPEEALPHVFEAFYRADRSRSRITGGSGLGLYIVQMILTLHHAWFHIENTSGGVRFTIRFPKDVFPPS